MSSWTAASSDCSRPVNNYVHVKTADLYRPNARLTPENRDIRYLRHLGNSDIAGNTALGDPRRTRESSGYGPNRITPGRSDLDFDPL